MLHQIEDSPLFLMANPRSMAFFGASNNIVSMGTNLLLSMLGIGYDGRIYPVHHKEKIVQGFTAYESVLDVPEVPDLALIVLPTPLVNQALETCGRKGIKRAIVVSGGFKETGEEGALLEKELVATACRYGLSILGPNCLGVANPHARVNTTFVPFRGRPGFIGLASQSGSFVTQMFKYLDELGLGFSTAFSVGNEANVDLVDCLEYLGACPQTKVIAVYLEGLKRGREFMKAARSIVPHKPIVVYYIGGSETGRRAGLSHTGSLAGPDDLYDGVFRQSGVIRAQSVTELFDFCWILGSCSPPAGPRVVIQTHSGGPGAAGADACGRAGLSLPSLSARTIECLADYVPHTGSVQNPVDVTFSRQQADMFTKIPQILLDDENSDLLLFYIMTPVPVMERALENMGLPAERLGTETLKMMNELADMVLAARNAATKPMVGYTWHALDESFIWRLINGGMPVFPEATRAARAIQALVAYHRWREKFMAEK